MTDILSKTQRSNAMAKVRSADTLPEWILRCGLHRLGFRYRLDNSSLPGRPDLAFPKYRSAIFVHGCYWHRHSGCKDASTPKSNVEFWLTKFEQNIERDRKAKLELEARGWRVLVVWECELTGQTLETIGNVANWLSGENFGRKVYQYSHSPADRKALLAVAEEKVRYRLASYKNKSK